MPVANHRGAGNRTGWLRQPSRPIAASLLVAGLSLACHRGTGPDRSSAGGEIGTVIRAALPAVVKVRPEGGMAQAIGSGFFLRGEDGSPCVVTNHHVVWGATEITIEENDGRLDRATVVGVDPKIDLAILRPRSSSGIAPLAFADDRSLRVGDPVVAIGSPGGIRNAASVGIVSARGNVPEGTLAGETFVEFLFVDARTGPGSSGGPVLDMDGRVIGVSTGIVGGGSGLGIVMPSHLAASVARKLLRTGAFIHSDAGIRVADERRDGYDGGGARVTSGLVAGAGVRSGLRVGDRIVALNGQRLERASDLLWHEFMDGPGTKWDLDVMRGGGRMPVALTLEALP